MATMSLAQVMADVAVSSAREELDSLVKRLAYYEENGHKLNARKTVKAIARQRKVLAKKIKAAAKVR